MTYEIKSQTAKRISAIVASAFLASVIIGGLAIVPSAKATVSFNPTAGTGFVGKGDVQTALGWNNAQLQAQASSVQFTTTTTTLKENDWTCTNTNNEKVQQKDDTTTTSTQQIVASIARTQTGGQQQVTGFNLNGYGSTISTSTVVTSGPPLPPASGSCPSGPWTYDNDLTSHVTSESGVLQVNGVTIYTF
jgi:hypothetical protein